MSLFSFSQNEPQLEYVEGGLYVVPNETEGFSALKVLKTDSRGVHVRFYSNVFETVPAEIDEQTLYMAGVDQDSGETMGMGHLPVSYESFQGWEAVFVQPSVVMEDELDGYEMWREAKGGYF